MRQGLETPPRTIMEVYQMLPEGTLAEVIDGNIYMSPAPSIDHQRIAGKIYKMLSDYSEQQNVGEVFISPIDVFLDETQNAVQPDIVLICHANRKIIKTDAIHGIPDLVIEILSKGNASHDQSLKRSLYEKFGVKEYWIVDPKTKETIGYSLKNQIYNECGRHTGQIVSPFLSFTFAF